MASKAQCRFCLEPTHTPENPFLQPCDCRGSIKNVHLDCLLQWRNTTHDYQNRIICQLCNTKYLMPTRWPIQTFPANSITHFCMKRFYVMAILIHVMHVSIVNSSQYDILFFTPQGLVSFHSLLFGGTVFYLLYIRNLISQLTAIKIYYQYLTPNLSTISILLSIVYVLTFVNPFIFGYSYIYLVTQLLTAHDNVITRMNNDAEYRLLE